VGGFAVVRERYADLVRLAYLVLDDGTAAPGVQLALARRLVRAAGRGHAKDYPELRRALVSRLAADPPRPHWTDRLPLRRAAPAHPEPGPVRTALRVVSPHERLAYVLCRLEGLTAPEVGAELGEFLAVSAYDVDASTAGIDTVTGLSAQAQRAELLAFDPTLVRLRPPAGRARRRVAAAVAVAALVAAGAFGLSDRGPTARPDDPVLVGSDRWRKEGFPSWHHWPAMGELRDDLALLRRAVGTWRGQRFDQPLGQVQVLYAGVQDEATYVVMLDTPGVRAAAMIVQYVERDRPAATRPRGRYGRLEGIRKVGGDSGQLIRLSDTDRVLVPPWLHGLELADPAQSSPQWRSLPVQNGVAGPVPLFQSVPFCSWNVLRMTHQAAAGPRQISMLLDRAPERPAPLAWFRPRDPSSANEPFQGGPQQWAALRSLTCNAPPGMELNTDLRVGRLWEGPLPAEGGRGTLLTIDTATAPSSQGIALLISPSGAVLSAPGPAVSGFSIQTSQLVGAVWWQAPRARRWYLMTAAGPDVQRLEISGDLGKHSTTGRGLKSLIRRGPVHPIGMHQDDRPAVALVTAQTGGIRTSLTP
jgi:hypothetical protein